MDNLFFFRRKLDQKSNASLVLIQPDLALIFLLVGTTSSPPLPTHISGILMRISSILCILVSLFRFIYVRPNLIIMTRHDVNGVSWILVLEYIVNIQGFSSVQLYTSLSRITPFIACHPSHLRRWAFWYRQLRLEDSIGPY